MGLLTNDEAILCKAFPNTLFDETRTWFTLLTPGSIESSHTLKKLFLDKFSTTGTISKIMGDLTNIIQREGESLLSFLERFKKTYDEIEGISQDTLITCFEGGFRSRILYTGLQLRKSETIGKMFSVARKVALKEESAQESQFRKKEKVAEALLPPLDKRGKN